MICSFPNYPFQSPRELQNENIGTPSCPSDKEEQKDSMFFEKKIVNYPSADDVVVPSGDIIWPESTGFLKPRMQRYRIVVVGAGYVGLSIAILLAGSNDVTIVDITPEKVDALNRCVSPIQDEFIIKYMNEAKSGKRMLHFRATLNAKSAYAEADFVVVAVPTNYDPQKNFLDCTAVEEVLQEVKSASQGRMGRPAIVIKSTVPIGFTRTVSQKLGYDRILFSPEFLRETKALYDNLYPSRIIVGCADGSTEAANVFITLLQQGACKKGIDTLIMSTDEAEAVKLFSNAYLALRVSYFNEMDTFAEMKGLNADSVIKGICLDPRIGDYYNNPSFGYGGYCLPKDTRQLLSDFQFVPENLIHAIVNSNHTRQDFIASRALEIARNNCDDSLPQSYEPNAKGIVIGIFKLNMKKDSDNCRNSSTQGVMDRIKARGGYMIIYEPSLPDGNTFLECPIVNDLTLFKKMSSCIIANRYDTVLDDVRERVYTRDIFMRD